jgi:hypothetical protein
MATTPHDDRRLPTGWGMPAGVAAGAAIGLLFGILLEQIAMGLTVGAAIGLVAGAALTTASATPPNRRAAVTAIAVALLAAGVTIVAFVVLR